MLLGIKSQLNEICKCKYKWFANIKIKLMYVNLKLHDDVYSIILFAVNLVFNKMDIMKHYIINVNNELPAFFVF